MLIKENWVCIARGYKACLKRRNFRSLESDCCWILDKDQKNLCLIISLTAALLLESYCCCNLLRCSFISLYDFHKWWSGVTQQDWNIKCVSTREMAVAGQMIDKTTTHLHLGTMHPESLQARAWSWSMYHIFLHRAHPPEARVLHSIPCRNSPFTLRQLELGYLQPVQLPERHVEACIRRSSIFLSCRIMIKNYITGWYLTNGL
jgi:hypothetical protein